MSPHAPAAPVPVIRADQRPVRLRRRNPGGMKVPDQDIYVLNRETPADSRVEQIAAAAGSAAAAAGAAETHRRSPIAAAGDRTSRRRRRSRRPPVSAHRGAERRADAAVQAASPAAGARRRAATCRGAPRAEPARPRQRRRHWRRPRRRCRRRRVNCRGWRGYRLQLGSVRSAEAAQQRMGPAEAGAARSARQAAGRCGARRSRRARHLLPHRGRARSPTPPRRRSLLRRAEAPQGRVHPCQAVSRARSIFGCRRRRSSATRSAASSRDADPLGFILFRAQLRRRPTQVRAPGRGAARLRRPRRCAGADRPGGRPGRAAQAAALAGLSGARRRSRALAGAAARRSGAARRAAHRRRSRARSASPSIACRCSTCPSPGADPVIGDRAYGSDPATVATLGRAVCEGLLAGGVLPVIKHIPGHGRAAVDSHHALPRGRRPRAPSSSAPISRRSARSPTMPWAMTAHIVYAAIDAEQPATLSPRRDRRGDPRLASASTACCFPTISRCRRLPGRLGARAGARARRRLRSGAALQRRDERDDRSRGGGRPLTRGGAGGASRAARRARLRAPSRSTARAAERRFAALLAGAAMMPFDFRTSAAADFGAGAAGDLRHHLARGGARLRRLPLRRRHGAARRAASPSIRCAISIRSAPS